MKSVKQLTIAVGPALTLAAISAIITLSCTSAPESQISAPEPQTTAEIEATSLQQRAFSAVLFPYIPDSGEDNFASLISSLEGSFESANPDIDLQLTIDPNIDVYDMGTLATLLGTGAGAVNMVEVDTILMGDLVSQAMVQPLPFDISGFGLLGTAVTSATVSSTVYGVPTYLCGNYIYSWDPGISSVNTGQGLIDFLSQSPNPSATSLIGNLKGSWTLPSAYVDAWADTYTNDPSQVATSYNLPLDPTTMGTFTPVVYLCGVNGGPCLGGSYKDNTLAETQFAQNLANGIVVYSERLFYILQARGGDITLPYVISAPLGVNSNPLMFVDALVLNPACAGQCASDSQTFSAFMSSLEVRNLIAFSEDVSPMTFPRYLLQALETFYTTSTGSQNLIYQQLWPFIQLAEAFPNQGFPESRVALNTELEQDLTGGVIVAAESPVGQEVGGVEIIKALTRFPDLGNP